MRRVVGSQPLHEEKKTTKVFVKPQNLKGVDAKSQRKLWRKGGVEFQCKKNKKEGLSRNKRGSPSLLIVFKLTLMFMM